MSTQPAPYQKPYATPAGQPHPTDRTELLKLAGQVDDALAAAIAEEQQTSYRDHTPIPRYGPTPPVPQHGTPPMSQRATDISRIIMYSSLATVPPGLIAIGIMVASEHANPTVIGMICAAPAALAIPILAIARLLRGAKEVVQAAPAEIHQHYTGNVYQDHRATHTDTRSIWARTTNELPR